MPMQKYKRVTQQTNKLRLFMKKNGSRDIRQTTEGK